MNIVKITPSQATIESTTPRIRPFMPISPSRASAKVAMAKYGVTAQVQNTAMKTVERHTAGENSILKLPFAPPAAAFTMSVWYAVSRYSTTNPCASSVLPFAHNQRGDSGNPSRPISSAAAMSVVVPSVTRQSTPAWSMK